ncbi:MAG: alpha/beta hydrolase, partial [Phyllobacterium sp.]
MFSTQLVAGSAFAQTGSKPEPLVIQDQGSFAVGGSVATTPGTYNNNAPSAEGQSLHGDHAYVFYKVPEKPKPLPIFMLHGAY